MPELRAWYDADRETFPAMDTAPIIHYKGRMIKKIQTTWEATLKRAGITRRLRPYDLRHQFITRTLEAGADLKTVSEIVGSSPKTILRHYQHVSTRQRRAVIAGMDPIPKPLPQD